MIIDFHTHAFPDRIAERAIAGLITSAESRYAPVTDGTVDGLLKNMDRCGIDVSVVVPVLTKPTQFDNNCKWIKEIESDRIVPFGGVHPQSDDYKRDIKHLASLGIKGIKFHAEFQDFVLDEPRMLRIYDCAFENGLIVLHHSGYDPSYEAPYRANPKNIASAIRQLGGGVFVAAHLGGHAYWDDVEEYLVGTDVYLDTSMGMNYYPEEQFLRIVKNHGAEKILFATDTPWSDGKEEIESLRALPLTEKEKSLILGENAKRLLGL